MLRTILLAAVSFAKADEPGRKGIRGIDDCKL